MYLGTWACAGVPRVYLGPHLCPVRSMASREEEIAIEFSTTTFQSSQVQPASFNPTLIPNPLSSSTSKFPPHLARTSDSVMMGGGEFLRVSTSTRFSTSPALLTRTFSITQPSVVLSKHFKQEGRTTNLKRMHRPSLSLSLSRPPPAVSIHPHHAYYA